MRWGIGRLTISSWQDRAVLLRQLSMVTFQILATREAMRRPTLLAIRIRSANALRRSSSIQRRTLLLHLLPMALQEGILFDRQVTGTWILRSFVSFRLAKNYRLELRGEGFNILNHPVLGYPNADLSNSKTFGTVTSTASKERQIQLAAKFIF